MKNSILFLLLITISLKCFSQISFENGYFITNDNDSVKCLIKDINSEKNRTVFKYKLYDSPEVKKAEISEVREFGAGTSFKYVRFTLDVDVSSEKMTELSYVKDPFYETKTIFLKLIIEGEATLYSDRDAYFFQKDGQAPEQLIYKQYFVNETNIATNEDYKKQLVANFGRDIKLIEDIKRLNFTKKELISFFRNYNLLFKNQFIVYQPENKGINYSISVKPAISITSISIRSVNIVNNIEIHNNLSYRFGVEGEVFLPVRKNRYSFVFEPTLQYYNSGDGFGIYGTDFRLNYLSVELPIGLRSHFYLGKNSILFVNGFLILDIPVNGELESEFGRTVPLSTSPGLMFGVGYKFHNLYSIEMRLYNGRAMFNQNPTWGSIYHSFSITLGYRIR